MKKQVISQAWEKVEQFYLHASRKNKGILHFARNKKNRELRRTDKYFIEDKTESLADSIF